MGGDWLSDAKELSDRVYHLENNHDWMVAKIETIEKILKDYQYMESTEPIRSSYKVKIKCPVCLENSECISELIEYKKNKYRRRYICTQCDEEVLFE